MKSRTKSGIVLAAAAAIGVLGVVGGTAASAEPSSALRAQCHLDGDMFVTGVPKGTHHVDYWSEYTVSSSVGPRFAVPTYDWLQPGDWVYAFAMASNGSTVLAQNLHVVCKY